MHNKILSLLNQIYDAETAAVTQARITTLIDQYHPTLSERSGRSLTHEDAILITYGDIVQQAGQPHLKTLHQFLSRQVAETITTVHILPFYRWSSDDGFSVIDYLAIDPPLGTWEEIAALRQDFRLMFDAVINHISQESDWFQRFLKGDQPYVNYFKTVDPSTDLSAVFRPRALPLLTKFETERGEQNVWTTFSADQIDLNYESPDLLLEVLNVLLAYVEHGADLIRLDAIGFMWKVPGTRSLHLPQTHAIIQLMRVILNALAPDVALITETNVPHQENISYFGDGTNEAQLVYNFSLPPLLLHAFHSGDSSYLTNWMKTLELPSDQTTFFNFCASHDGIGVTPARGILPPEEIDRIALRVQRLGGRVSYKTNGDGTQSPYELNINYLNALGVPLTDEPDALKGKRFLTSQAIMLALRGVPGIYFHSLFGSESWAEGIEACGHNRAINREKLQSETLEAELSSGLRHIVFSGYQKMLNARAESPAFNPYGEQKIYDLHNSVVALSRSHAGETVFCYHNISAESVSIMLPKAGHPQVVEDLISGKKLRNATFLPLSPYEFRWLRGL